MSQDCLIVSTISTRSPKNVSCANGKSSPSILSNDTKTSKVSEKSNTHEFYPKKCSHAFLIKTDYEEYRSNTKKGYGVDPDYSSADGCPDHPSTFIKIIALKQRES